MGKLVIVPRADFSHVYSVLARIILSDIIILITGNKDDIMLGVLRTLLPWI